MHRLGVVGYKLESLVVLVHLMSLLFKDHLLAFIMDSKPHAMLCKYV